MKRQDFIKKGFLGTGIFAATLSGLKAIANSVEELHPLEGMNPNEIVGFNHLGHTDSAIASNRVLHRAATRGTADHGWLQTRHTFSFANYYNPERMHFGVLRVLNDDIIAGSRGFGMHPHDNMEIITIPLDGDLEHRDNMGHTGIIKKGDIQVMSAGTGIRHSEFNARKDQPVSLLQIWLFPGTKDVTPRYDQLSLQLQDRKNNLQQVLSPHRHDAGVWIQQRAWFHLADFDTGHQSSYKLKTPGNGIYVFNIKGTLQVGDITLQDRDGIGIWDISDISIEAVTAAEFLVMEVPMSL